MGTLDYVAPEQIRGDIDGRADGTRLRLPAPHECLIGAAPFRKKARQPLIYAHLQDPPPLSGRHAPRPPVAGSTASLPRRWPRTGRAIVHAGALAMRRLARAWPPNQLTRPGCRGCGHGPVAGRTSPPGRLGTSSGAAAGPDIRGHRQVHLRAPPACPGTPSRTTRRTPVVRRSAARRGHGYDHGAPRGRDRDRGGGAAGRDHRRSLLINKPAQAVQGEVVTQPASSVGQRVQPIGRRAGDQPERCGIPAPEPAQRDQRQRRRAGPVRRDPEQLELRPAEADRLPEEQP